jgi:hypothetical protein
MFCRVCRGLGPFNPVQVQGPFAGSCTGCAENSQKPILRQKWMFLTLFGPQNSPKNGQIPEKWSEISRNTLRTSVVTRKVKRDP